MPTERKLEDCIRPLRKYIVSYRDEEIAMTVPLLMQPTVSVRKQFVQSTKNRTREVFVFSNEISDVQGSFAQVERVLLLRCYFEQK